MEKDKIFEIVVAIAMERLDYEGKKIQRAFSIINDLGVDSLDQIELIMALEERFEISIPDGEAEKIETVRDIVEYIFSALK